MSISGRQYELNGIRLNVYVEGQWEPVLLLHGFPDSNYLCGPLEHWFDQTWRPREIETVK